MEQLTAEERRSKVAIDMPAENIWQRLLDLEGARRDKDFLKSFKAPPRIFRDAFYFLMTLLSKTLFEVKISGVSNIPVKGPYILAANHSSAMDYPLVAWAMPREPRDNLYAVTTSYFYDNPFAHLFIMVATNSIRIDTSDDYGPALKTAAKVLAQGGAVYINPEGTWSETGQLMPFKPGVGLLSYELKVPIVPVYISGTFDILPPHAVFPKRRGKITLSFGEPIQPSEAGEGNYYIYKKIADDVRQEIINLRDKKTGI